jgi:hypothetical protein
MSRPVTSAFAAIALFLVLFPLALAKPGLPLSLKSDEPAYYLMALSLVHDRDLVCDLGDIRRLGVEFPHNTARNLILGSDDGFRTVYFAKPYLVSLLAAPMTALFGADGFVATNMALLLLSVWLGALYLRRFNPDWLALLFALGFFLASNAFAYVFWLHTEVLCIASVTACLYFAFAPGAPRPGAGRRARLGALLAREPVRTALSGAALVAGAYNKPYLALLGLPALALACRRRSWRGAGAWLAGAAVASALVCGASVALVGKPTPYLGFARFGVSVDAFDRMPELPTPSPVDPRGAAPNSFAWIFESFRFDADTLPNLGYFLVGRHTGLLPYAPFALLALGLFLALRPRSAERWLLLAALAGIALYSLTFIWFNWHGGGGFVGNRYYVGALPGFLFLVTRIAPAWLPLAGYALGGLFLGGIVFTPFGAAVDSPTLQAHARNLPFQLLPFERTLAAQIPGYRGAVATAGSFVHGRADLFRPIGDSLWVVGGQRVELELRTVAPLRRPVFELATFIAPNRVEIALGGTRAVVDFASAEPPGNATRALLAAPRARRDTLADGTAIAVYPLEVEAERQLWRHEEVKFRASKKAPRGRPGVAAGVQLPDWEESELNVLVGAVVTYLGEEEELTADLYDAAWLDLRIPEVWPAGRIVALPVRFANRSGTVWRATGATAVALSYHWLRADGTPLVWEGLRSPLPKDVPPGEAARAMLEVETPGEPGRYTLAVDLVRERVAWFSERRPHLRVDRPVEIARVARR